MWKRVRETYRHFKARSWLAFPCLSFSFLKVPSLSNRLALSHCLSRPVKRHCETRVQTVEEGAHVLICLCRFSNPEGDKLNQPTTSKSTQETCAGLHSLDEITLFEDFCSCCSSEKIASVLQHCLYKKVSRRIRKRKVLPRTTEKIYGSKQVLGAVTPKTE